MSSKSETACLGTGIALATWMLFIAGAPAPPPFSIFIRDFAAGYQKLDIPEIAYDYKEYFSAIPASELLLQQEQFFRDKKKRLEAYVVQAADTGEAIQRYHLQYEIDFNLERIMLEKAWVTDGRKIPQRGLYELKNRRGWYRCFIRRYTGLSHSPEEIMAMGMQEVARVQKEIRSIRLQSGFTDSMAFYNHLQSEAFILRDKQAVDQAFERADSIIRKHLRAFTGDMRIPPVYAMEWPGADGNTPPGSYLNRQNNPYGKDVVQYNFYGSRYNSRAIEWLYMHEAIPGHHLQATIRNTDTADELQALFLYPGNFEGWACYVEYYGKTLGMYADPYSNLGKWEWDLVRSARLVIDAGIHYDGWSPEEALDYWKKNIPGQDGIAAREITRVTGWPAQALSYKAGAACIERLRQQMMEEYGAHFDERKFHRAYLSFGMRPLQVIRQHFETVYREYARS